MKNLIFIVFLAIPALLSAQVRTGINTQVPTTTLHVKAIGTDDPLLVEGLKPGSGQFLVLDNNGVVKISTDKSNLAFVIPSVSNTVGVGLTQTSQTGSTNYTENSGPTGTIPGGGSWTKITGMQSTFNILQAANTLSINAEGMVQYDGTLSSAAAISYGLGIFLDGKLIATRNFIMAGDNSVGTSQKWSLLGQASSLTVGSHVLEIYVTRRNTVGTAPNSIYVAQPVPNSTVLSQFMAKAIMQINGVYN
ncbi:hypothetical protein [Pedobacter nototheniae]|uniref:hypothetical protein n=1 Tax=Pedobacter nototheniae TaxID=2488994 RepID=UPI00293157BF|nr:hypothetical protein [Pedobacter nototheniae]